MSAARYALFALASASAACGGSMPGSTAVTSPTAITVSTPTPPASPLRGQIALTSLPAAGTTLVVTECSANSGYHENCAYARLAASVEVEQAVPDAVVTTSFYRGAERCGIAHSSKTALPAHLPTPFAATAISFADEYVAMHCAPLPTETGRVVVQLWSAAKPAVPLLTQEFSYSYTFVQQ